MCTNAPAEQTNTNQFRWRRDLHRYEHTIAFEVDEAGGNYDSYGHFLDRTFITEAGEYIGDKADVQVAAAVWHAANDFHKFFGAFRRQAEQTCNVIAALDGVKRHDVVLDEETWAIVDNMQSGSVEQNALDFAITDLRRNVLERLKWNADRLRDVFRPALKDKVEGRLERLIAEQKAMLHSFEEIMTDLGLPQSAYQVRQYVLSQMIVYVEKALEIITPLRRELKDAAVPDGWLKRIVDNEAIFFRARAQLKKWRDNPSQKFGGKMKEMAILLVKTNNDMAELKDPSYHAISKLGARFFTRCGRARNPYF